MLTDLIAGRLNPWLEVFDATRIGTVLNGPAVRPFRRGHDR
jgi:hypothetical protein